MDKMAQDAGKAGVPLVLGIPAMTFGEYDYGLTTGQLIKQIANKQMPAYLQGNRNVVYAATLQSACYWLPKKVKVARVI